MEAATEMAQIGSGAIEHPEFLRPGVDDFYSHGRNESIPEALIAPP